MSQKQTKDIFKNLPSFHNQLSDLYHQLSNNSEKEIVKILLDHLSQRHMNIQKKLIKYE